MARTCSRDVSSNILCRLRVKSLKRLQCVCKSWYALIRNPSFVTQHLHFHSRQEKNTHLFTLSRATVHRQSCITDTYVNGNVHWLAFEGDPSRKDGYILSFDMVREVFAKMKLPDSRICEDEYDSVFAVGNESLSLIVYPMTPHYPMETSDTKCFDVWVMQEYGNDRSWTKQFTIGPIAFVERLLGFWRNGEFLLEDGWGYTSSYDPSTQKISMERLYFAEGLHLWQSCIYTESLVSVTRNAPSDFQILVEDIPFVITPHMKRVLDYVDKLEIVNIVPRV